MKKLLFLVVCCLFLVGCEKEENKEITVCSRTSVDSEYYLLTTVVISHNSEEIIETKTTEEYKYNRLSDAIETYNSYKNNYERTKNSITRVENTVTFHLFDNYKINNYSDLIISLENTFNMTCSE